MSAKNNGGAAFPGKDDRGFNETGMVLRDYFAAKALQAIIGNESTSTTPESCMTDAKWAYQYADAMLAAREKE